MDFFYTLLFVSINLFIIVQCGTVGTLENTENCGSLDRRLINQDRNAVDSHEYPWTAEIRQKIKGTMSWKKTPRQGVLLSNRIVITVHHRFVKFEACEVEVILGFWSSASQRALQTYNVDEVIRKPGNYSSPSDEPVILHLDRDVIFSPVVQPICLPATDVMNDYLINKRLYIGGMIHDDTIPDTLNQVRRRKSFIYLEEKTMFDVDIVEISFRTKKEFNYKGGAAIMDIKYVDGRPKYFYMVGLKGGVSKYHFVSVFPFLEWIKYLVKLSS